jgi:hypothetical protein
MNPWRCLVELNWMTGRDGRLAFWKVAYAALLVLFSGIIWHMLLLMNKMLDRNVPAQQFSSILWPLLWFFVMFISAAFGFKGIEAYLHRIHLGADIELSKTMEHPVVTTPKVATTVNEWKNGVEDGIL